LSPGLRWIGIRGCASPPGIYADVEWFGAVKGQIASRFRADSGHTKRVAGRGPRGTLASCWCFGPGSVPPDDAQSKSVIWDSGASILVTCVFDPPKRWHTKRTGSLFLGPASRSDSRKPASRRSVSRKYGSRSGGSVAVLCPSGKTRFITRAGTRRPLVSTAGRDATYYINLVTPGYC